jgi:type I restriction enzyme S subunit
MPEVTLGDVASFINGDRSKNYPSGRDFVPGGIPFVSAADLSGGKVAWNTTNTISEAAYDRLGSGKIQSGDLLFSLRGSLGKVARIASVERACIASSLVIVRASPLIDRDYLYYVLSGPIGQAAAKLLDNGSVQGNISVRDLKTTKLPFPSFAEQKRIASALACLDNKIDLNRRMSETLDAMGQAIYRDWFVDFGPVRRKLAGVTDPVEIMGGIVSDTTKAAELAAQFPDQFANSGLPVGWSLRPFGQLLSESIGGDWGVDSPSGESSHPVCIIRGTDFEGIRDGGVGKTPTRFTTKAKRDSRFLRADDIVLEVSGGSPTQPTGRSLAITQNILDRFAEPVVCATFCRRLRPVSKVEGAIARTHLSVLYNEGGTWEYQNQSTGISNFQTTHFLKAEMVAWPCSGVAQAFAEIVGPMSERASTNESLELEHLRDYLLPRLMSGEVRVRDVAREIAA